MDLKVTTLRNPKQEPGVYKWTTGYVIVGKTIEFSGTYMNTDSQI